MKYNHLVFLVVLFVLSACKNNPDNIKGVIPKNDLTEILYEIQLTDGILADGNFYKPYRNTKKFALYDTIFQIHGYSREQFIFTMETYGQFPEDLTLIYTEITEKLNVKLQEIIAKNELVEEQKRKVLKSLWRRRQDWNFIDDSTINIHSLNFKIPTKGLGKYIIEADILLEKKDPSKNPTLTASFTYFNGETTELISSRSLKIKKSDEKIHYTLELELLDTTATNLEGNLFQTKKALESSPKLKIENITIMFEPFGEDKQMSIKDLRKEKLQNNSKSNTEKNSGYEDLWKGEDYYTLPYNGKQNTISFSSEIEVGKIKFEAEIIIYPDDQSVNPKIYFFLFEDDESPNGRRETLIDKQIPKDGQWHSYKFDLRNSDPTYTHLKGRILNHYTNREIENWQKHAEVKNIRIQYFPISDTLEIR